MNVPRDDCTGNPAVRVVLVDLRDDRRGVMRQMVETDETYARVVGEANSAVTAVELLAGVQADAVILELEMPVAEGVKAIPALRQCSSRLRIIVSSFSADRDTSERAIAEGADTYLRKPLRRSELRAALANLGQSADLADVTPPDSLVSPGMVSPGLAAVRS